MERCIAVLPMPYGSLGAIRLLVRCDLFVNSLRIYARIHTYIHTRAVRVLHVGCMCAACAVCVMYVLYV